VVQPVALQKLAKPSAAEQQMSSTKRKTLPS
jgi:hypothetical protein